MGGGWWGLNGNCKEKWTPQCRGTYVCMMTIPMHSLPIPDRRVVGFTLISALESYSEDHSTIDENLFSVASFLKHQIQYEYTSGKLFYSMTFKGFLSSLSKLFVRNYFDSATSLLCDSSIYPMKPYHLFIIYF